MPARHRVLILAEAANPQWVSVPLVGWGHARALMDVCDAHLVTQIRNRKGILESGGGLIEGRDFTAIDSEAVARVLSRVSHFVRRGSATNWTAATMLQSMAYPYFEKLVWDRFGPEIRRGRWDIVHRITPLTPAAPSYIAAKIREAGVPFVLGPLNGGVPWPRGFRAVQHREREWLSHVRELYRLWPGYRSTRRYASAILVGSRVTYEQVPRSFHAKTFYMPENAIDPAKFKTPRTRRAALPIRAIFVGRLVPLKGMDMLLEAAAPILRDGKITIEIVGDGPELGRMKALVEKEQIGSAVQFVGWLPHDQVLQRLAGNDLFLLPSIREFGGGAALEAMAVGLPPLVLKYGGPGELVTPATGFLVEMGTRPQIVSRLRAVLSDVVADPGVIERASQVAYRRAHEQFTWAAKVRQTLAVYDWVRGRSRQRPTFPMPIPDPPM
jgi:glycosyltransferase involved in cell wall biosynthesis